MDKLLSYIDIAQEDGAENPAATHSRIKAKTNGGVVLRSPAGVESPTGGIASAQAVGVVLSQDVVIPTKTFTEIPQLSVTIPPGKSARVTGFLFSRFVSTSTATQVVTVALRVKCPAGANMGVVGSSSIRSQYTSAARADHNYTGNFFVVVADGTFDFNSFGLSITPTANDFAGAVIEINLRNESTTTSATVVAAINPATAGDVAMTGASIFAIIG